MPNKPQSAVYVGGEDPEVVKKRAAYEQAQEKLQQALESRQSRMFDPALLGAATGFLTGSQTGSFWEGLGRAAKGYSAGEQEANKEAQDLAQQQMSAAQTGLEVERQRQSDMALRRYLGQATPNAPSAGGLPAPAAGGLPAPGTLSAGSLPVTGALPAAGPARPAEPSEQPKGPLADIGQYGIRFRPADSNRMTGKKFIELNMYTMPAQELLKEAHRIDAENTKTTEAGTVDLAEGTYYPAPKGELVSRQIYGYGPKGETQTVSIPQQTAFILDQLAATGDPRYYDVVEQLKSGPPRKKMQAVTGQPGVTPVEAPEVPAIQPLKTSSEVAASAAAESELQKGRAGSAVKTEEQLPAKNEAAGRAFQAAADTERLVKKNPAAFGVLQRPGVASGILNLVSQGLQTPSGRISIPQLDAFIVQTTGKDGDLVDRQLAARSLAELELAFRRQYFAGYGGGAISDKEQNIILQLTASPLEDPRAIAAKMALIKMRSQYDLDEYRNWVKFQRQNKNLSYTDFIQSDDYLNRLDQYSSKVGKAFGTEPAVPTEKKAQPKTGGFTPEQIKAARDRLLNVGGR